MFPLISAIIEFEIPQPIQLISNILLNKQIVGLESNKLLNDINTVIIGINNKKIILIVLYRFIFLITAHPNL